MKKTLAVLLSTSLLLLSPGRGWVFAARIVAPPSGGRTSLPGIAPSPVRFGPSARVSMWPGPALGGVLPGAPSLPGSLFAPLPGRSPALLPEALALPVAKA